MSDTEEGLDPDERTDIPTLAELARYREFVNDRGAAHRTAWIEGYKARAAEGDTAKDPALLAMLARHREHWWTATPAERIADMAEYARAKLALLEACHPGSSQYAARSVVEALELAAGAGEHFRRIAFALGLIDHDKDCPGNCAYAPDGKCVGDTFPVDQLWEEAARLRRVERETGVAQPKDTASSASAQHTLDESTGTARRSPTDRDRAARSPV